MEKTITDQYHGDPTYAQLHVLTRERPKARGMLKTASFDQVDVDTLPSTAFAWEDERRFPVHTKEDTVASILYRSKLGSAVPEYVDDKLIEAAKIYGINRRVFDRVKQAGGVGGADLSPDAQTLKLYQAERTPLSAVAAEGRPAWFAEGLSPELLEQIQYGKGDDWYTADLSVPVGVAEQQPSLANTLAEARAAQAGQPKVAHYALPKEKRLPLDSGPQIKLAEHVLCRDYTKLPLEKRADAFSKLVQQARRHDVELNDLTLKMAGMTISSTAVLRDWLEARAAASEGKVSEAFDKMAEGLLTAPPYIQDRKDLVKVAATIDELDRKAGLDQYYDRKLPDPLQTVFNTNKLAALMVDLGGQQVDVAELMQLPPDTWDQLGVPELSEVVQSGDEATFKQIFDTLPLDIKMTLQAQLG